MLVEIVQVVCGRKMTSSESLEWRQARQWLISSQVIPITHRVTKPEVDLVDFARSLRDGVFLCSLLRTLKPGSVPDTDWTPKPLMQVCDTGFEAYAHCHTCLTGQLVLYLILSLSPVH